jgi:hypothetical protein
LLIGNKLAKVSEKKVKNLVFAGYVEDFRKTSIAEIYKKGG